MCSSSESDHDSLVTGPQSIPSDLEGDGVGNQAEKMVDSLIGGTSSLQSSGFFDDG